MRAWDGERAGADIQASRRTKPRMTRERGSPFATHSPNQRVSGFPNRVPLRRRVHKNIVERGEGRGVLTLS
jgi:hypothetical protein